MRFTVEPQKMDLGETSVENIFLNHYLQLADGNHLKVYLFAYKNAKSIYGQKDLSDEEIDKLDEAMILFHMRGHEIGLFEGDRTNFKVTRPSDIKIANAMIRG